MLPEQQMIDTTYYRTLVHTACTAFLFTHVRYQDTKSYLMNYDTLSITGGGDQPVPRFSSLPRVYKGEVGEEVLLLCRVNSLGELIVCR